MTVQGPTNVDLVRQLWERFDAGDFQGAGDLVHEDFVMDWPQSRERIRGRSNFVAVNRNYPGRWRCRPRRIVDCESLVISEVEVTDGTTVVYALSFFEAKDGLLARAREYWGDTYEAPAWRAPWVERY